ncbi:MAG: ornithine cyclodeaminase family protein [Synergistales bacterium]|nr:ornithine cyclodeaminase family protein [Synergistales bacterium]
MGDVLWLSQAEVESLNVSMAELVDAVEEGFKLKGEGKVELPAKIGVHARKDCYIHAMPCWIGGDVDVMGIKWAAGYPSNQAKGLPYINGIWCMNDCETGMLKAVMDANWMTAYRTGAASGVCAKYMADPDSEVVSIIGLGVQGRTNLLAMQEVLPKMKRVQIYDIFPQQVEKYLAAMQPQVSGAEFVNCPDVESCVKDADVVITCAPILEKPERFVRSSWLKEDVLAIAVDYDSSFDADIMIENGPFVCDDKNQYLSTQSWGVYFQGGYPLSDQIYADMGELCAGIYEPVRKGTRGAVLMGIASHDIMTGRLLYKKALEKGIGTWVKA